jgi:hypothetical protein
MLLRENKCRVNEWISAINQRLWFAPLAQHMAVSLWLTGKLVLSYGCYAAAEAQPLITNLHAPVSHRLTAGCCAKGALDVFFHIPHTTRSLRGRLTQPIMASAEGSR